MKIGPLDITRLDRIDLRWHNDQPVLVGWTDDNRCVGYPLTPAEMAALVRRLAGYLATHHRDPVDRTGETVRALAQEGTA